MQIHNLLGQITSLQPAKIVENLTRQLGE